MIRYEEPIGLKSYTICIDTKKITLYTPHLRKKARERIERGHPIHTLVFNDVKYYVKFKIGILIESGYIVVFEKNKEEVLLIYNK